MEETLGDTQTSFPISHFWVVQRAMPLVVPIEIRRQTSPKNSALTPAYETHLSRPHQHHHPRSSRVRGFLSDPVDAWQFQL